jgi:hypothetical protein
MRRPLQQSRRQAEFRSLHTLGLVWIAEHGMLCRRRQAKTHEQPIEKDERRSSARKRAFPATHVFGGSSS